MPYIVHLESEVSQEKDDRLNIEAIWTDRNNVKHREKVVISFNQPNISSDIAGIKIILNGIWIGGTHYDNNLIVSPKKSNHSTDNAACGSQT